MSSEFNHLKLRPELACEFLGVFARSEYALKVAGFRSGNESRVDADWDAFAKAIATSFNPSDSQGLREAVDYLLTKPPQKIVLKNGNLELADASPDKNQSEAQQVLLMVRRVRNNLFHGGKFLPVPAGDPDRDKLLVEHSLAVLRKCIQLYHQVDEAYRK